MGVLMIDVSVGFGVLESGSGVGGLRFIRVGGLGRARVGGAGGEVNPADRLPRGEGGALTWGLPAGEKRVPGD